jgi:hypothetical protein
MDPGDQVRGHQVGVIWGTPLRSITFRFTNPADHRVRSGSKAEKLGLSICCPLSRRKRTSLGRFATSALCQNQTLLSRFCTSASGLTPPVLRAHNAPSSKVVRMPFANQTRDRLDHAASDARCARQPPRRSADGRPAPTTIRQMALQNAQTNRRAGHRSAYGLSARQSAQVHRRSPTPKN